MNTLRVIIHRILASPSGLSGGKRTGLVLSLCVVLFLSGANTWASSLPTISGVSPIDVDTFIDDSVELTVYSYAFEGSGSSVPGEITPPLLDDQCLLVYLIENTSAEQAEADFLQIANPDTVDVIGLGTVNSIVPSGYQENERHNPAQYYTGLGGDTDSIIRYQWFDVPEYGLQYLHQGEWALVSLRVLGLCDEVLATAGHTSTGGVNRGIPGPIIPEPASLAVFLGGLLIAFRRGAFRSTVSRRGHFI
jgi:hypothetical protein